MSESMHERRAAAERLRPYFETQLLFAERLSEKAPMALAEACLRYTNLHRRFGFGRAIESGPARGWTDYVVGLASCYSAPDRVEWTVDFYSRHARPVKDPDPLFGCFSCEPPNTQGVVRIHFHNRDVDGDAGPLARHKADRRVGELRAMFGYVRARHPDARQVLGGSWLYNLEAYRRLFPPVYVASRFEPERVRLDGTSSWGQLLDFRGYVKADVRAAILRNLDAMDVAAPWRSFPMRALGALADIDHFYWHYGL